MEETTKVDLPSGAKLEIYPADFLVAKRLYQVIAKEAEEIRVSGQDEVENLFKDILMRAISSEKIDAQLWECMKKCTYNGLRITPQTFEPVVARGDYLLAMFEVAVVNVSPFTKSLFTKFADISGKFREALASKFVNAVKPT